MSLLSAASAAYLSGYIFYIFCRGVRREETKGQNSTVESLKNAQREQRFVLSDPLGFIRDYHKPLIGSGVVIVGSREYIPPELRSRAVELRGSPPEEHFGSEAVALASGGVSPADVIKFLENENLLILHVGLNSNITLNTGEVVPLKTTDARYRHDPRAKTRQEKGEAITSYMKRGLKHGPMTPPADVQIVHLATQSKDANFEK